MYLTHNRLESWHRLVVEVVQAQPIEFGIGFSSMRAWVNKTATPRVYFGDFSIGFTPADGNNVFFDLCGCYDPVNNVVDSSRSGSLDVMNFLWFEGAESLFQDSSGMLFCLFSSLN